MPELVGLGLLAAWLIANAVLLGEAGRLRPKVTFTVRAIGLGRPIAGFAEMEKATERSAVSVRQFEVSMRKLAALVNAAAPPSDPASRWPPPDQGSFCSKGAEIETRQLKG